jgi:hypothetical protein
MNVQHPGTAVTAGRAWRASGCSACSRTSPQRFARLLLITPGALTP